MNRKFWFSLILLSVSGVLPASAMALDCFQKSPGFEKLGDKYWDFEEYKPLSREQKKAIQKFFSKVERDLEGTGSYTDCLIEGKKGTMQTVPYKLKARFNIDSDAKVKFDIDVLKIKERAEINEVLEYFTENTFEKIVSVDGNSMTLVQFFRRPAYNKGVRLKGSQYIERLTKMTTNKHDITIEVITYVNGYFGFIARYELKD